MSHVYSTYEAKAKFSEILRKVRSGQRVRISYRGETVAEVAPVEAPKATFEERLKQLEAEGVIGSPGKPSGGFPRLKRRPGALARFLRSRD
jgi:prevent-host-death family protein